MTTSTAITKKRKKGSKKYAVGTLHESLSGEFKIIDRYFKNEESWLKLEYVNSGEVVENKEANVISNLHKYRQKKKAEIADGSLSPEEVVGLTPELSFKALFEKMETLERKFDRILELLEESR